MSVIGYLDSGKIIDVGLVNPLPIRLSENLPTNERSGYGYSQRLVEKFIATSLNNLGTNYVNILTAAADTNPTIQNVAGYSLIKFGFEVAANARFQVWGRYTDHNGVPLTAWQNLGELPDASTWYAAGSYSVDIQTATRIYDMYRIDVKFETGTTNTLIYAVLGVAG